VHLVAAETDDYKVIRNDAMTLEEIRELNPTKILISPGPGRPHEAGITEEIIRELGKKTPVLGVCLGHQAIGEVFGAKVVYAPKLMHGKVSQVSHDDHFIFKGIEKDFTATRYHSLVLDPETIPEVLQITAHSDDGVIQGVRHKEFPIQGIQFHPESILTTEGPKIIQNWLRQ
jgi:anthranilate synthase component 2